jgi:hypothetical protein
MDSAPESSRGKGFNRSLMNWRDSMSRGYVPDDTPLQDAVALVLDTNYLGLAVTVEPGDIVVIVIGSRLPLVLRLKGEHYELVSAAYIAGVMDGEAWAYGEDQFASEPNADEGNKRDSFE